ncbi:hypothetical protein FPHYL_5007 [Fusarium phyllophilum]|uniref:Heterokaryon incompatibility domain-containing protein n=1 Tax=Fusarium phyllophilum TaxID=47803 RepID=A0A8H5K183_9HYPO|nr:hypothetical protein FPHYL_5007 [Fusarium phyllophilum]
MATNNSTTKAGSARRPAPGVDIFKTPENPTFYSANLYQSLDTSKQEIRLIEISTQTGDESILECKLLPATLLTDARKHYLALSYCAGDPTDTKEILVNGVRCNIFANLHHALVLARQYWIRSSGEGPLRLWVDQLCINQHDLSERSHQVGFMRNIYQSAERTLACLSTSTTSGDGLKWFSDLCDAVPFQEDDGPLRYKREDELGTAIQEARLPDNSESELLGGRPEQWLRVYRYVLDHISIDKFVDEWIAFYDLLGSSWWNRAWICQEFIVSEQVSFLFGHYSASWERCWKNIQGFCEFHRWFFTRRTLFSILSWLPAHGLEDRQLRRILDIVQARDLNHQVDHVRNALRMKTRWSGSMEIKTLLSHSRSCKSSDDRDRVYAVLGLASPGYQIFPNYSKDISAEDVMIMTTRAIIEKEDSLSVLVPATRLIQGRNLDVPSWVVDWSSREASYADWGNVGWDRKNSITHESTQCKFETITNKTNQTRAHILWVYGTCITRIRRVTREWPFAVFYSAQERHEWSGQALISIGDGDELWILYGSRVPMVLRPYLDGYQVISSANMMEPSPMSIEEVRANRSRIKLY